MVSRMVAFCDRSHDDGDRIAVGTETFTLNGKTIELDLCEDHTVDFKEFLEAQQVWADAGRTVGGPKRTRSTSPVDPAAGAEAPAGAPRLDRDRMEGDARAWARTHGWPDLQDRGRLPEAARVAFRRAQADDAHRRWDEHAGDDDTEETPVAPSVPVGAPAARIPTTPLSAATALVGRLGDIRTSVPSADHQESRSHG